MPNNTPPQPPLQIRPLPTPPTMLDTASFPVRGDEFIGALPDFQQDANALAENVAHNTSVAYEAAQAAVPAAAAATAAAEAAVPAGAQATQAAALAVPAAARAEAAAQHVDEVAANIKDGPVTSVMGRTGIVDLTEELHAAALYF